MKYLSVCSGIEAASVAWEPLGWKPVGFSEIEKFPRAVLAHHFPGVPIHGDFTKIDPSDVSDADLLVGGTPCQAFSVAGLRNSLDDARGNLTLAFVRLADAIDTVRLAAGKERIRILWENVPGVLTTKDNAFGCFLGALSGNGSALQPPDGRSWPDAGVAAGESRVVAWRILDAQWFGVAQRRRRVFVLAGRDARDWSVADALLPITQGLRRDPPSRRKARQEPATSFAERTRGGGGLETDAELDGGLIASTPSQTDCDRIAPTLYARFAEKQGCENQHIDSGAGLFITSEVSATVTAKWAKGSGGPAGSKAEISNLTIGTMTTRNATSKDVQSVEEGYAIPVAMPLAFDTTQITSKTNGSNPKPGDPCHTLHKGDAPSVAIGFQTTDNGEVGGFNDMTPKMKALAPLGVATNMAVRRLTPRECERLQGFPDDWTLIPWRGKPAEDCPDGPRYKACGNSMAVPVMRWIGRQIQKVDTPQSAE